jgi:hypothetical protein
MKTNRKTTSEPDSEHHSSENTEYFTKFLNRFYKEDWCYKPNFVAVFIYLLSIVNWKESYIISKSGKPKRKLEIGQCIISEDNIAKKLGLPRAQIRRILQFFQNKEEIKLEPTTENTIVTVNYLLKSEQRSLQRFEQRNEQRFEQPKHMALNNLEHNVNNDLNSVLNNDLNNDPYISKDELDKKDNIDIKYSNENEIFVEKGIDFLKKEEEKDTKTLIDEFFFEPEKVIENKSVKDIVLEKPKSEIDILLDIWSEEYLLARKINYVVTSGKDKQGIKNLLNLFKQKQPQLDKQGMIEYFRNFCKQTLAIKDQFICKGINPAFAYSQINQIRTIQLSSINQTSFSSEGYTHLATKPDYSKENLKFYK